MKQKDKSCNWRALVKSALADSSGMEDIYRELSSSMVYLARKGPVRHAEDILQAGRLAVWNKLRLVSRRRSGASIKAFLRRVALNAMKDETRRLIRQDRCYPLTDIISDSQADGHFQGANYITCDGRQFFLAMAELRFSNLLKMYASYIRKNGHFAGAHKAVAEKLGISIPLITRRFHAHASKWQSINDLTPLRKKHAKIIEMVLNGQISQ